MYMKKIYEKYSYIKHAKWNINHAFFLNIKALHNSNIYFNNYYFVYKIIYNYNTATE